MAASHFAVDLMRESLNQARVRFGSRHQGVTVSLEGPGELCLWADRHSLTQVLASLILQSFQSVQGQGRLVLGWFRVNGGVSLWVDDSGPGFDADQLGRLFEPSTPAPEGAALSLWQCQTQIEDQGGVLRTFSRPGSGASMVVWLPQPIA